MSRRSLVLPALYWAFAIYLFNPIAVMVAMGAWALSLVRKVARGEEVEFPL